MAAVAAMRTALTHLGFTQDVADTITNVQLTNSSSSMTRKLKASATTFASQVA